MSDSPYDRAQHVLDDAMKQWNSQPLRSIFSEISQDDASDARHSYQPSKVFVAPGRFTLDARTLMPTEGAPAHSSIQQDFVTAYAQTSAQQPLRLEQTLALLRDYAWAVASPEVAVSLYDYARTEAALAAAGNEVLMVGGDLSGVQSFIYTIAADKATKSLRGRSLYLQLLTDAVAHWVLNATGMPLTNLLYSGGGRFYVLVPQSYAGHIDAWRRQLGEFLLTVHDGELYVALGAAAFTSASKPNFAPLFQAVNEQVNADKRRRFSRIDGAQLHTSLFQPRGHRGNEEDRCVICGYMGAHHHFVAVVDDENPATDLRPPQRCNLCHSLIDLGGYLHDAFALVCGPRQPNLTRFDGRVSWHQVLQSLGLETWVVKHDTKLNELLARESERPMRVHIVQSATISADLDALRATYPQHSVEFRPIVNVTPRDDAGAVKSFGDLAQASAGVKRFGVLRMDVDDLGDIFSYSLRDASLARISTLSAALARFFEGWVGEICRSPTADNRVYSVYSGGDDLFLVGSWDVLPAVAQRIQADLERYTGGNKLIHVSGGLTLHSEKFPLYQAAKAAHDALDAAKSAPERGPLGRHKNALHWLDQTIGWEHFTELEALRARLEQMVTAQSSTRSLLQTLMQLYGQYQDTLNSSSKTGDKQLFFGAWIWHGMYQLTRISERYPKTSADREWITSLRGELVSKTTHTANITARTIEQAGLAARWVQLLIRTKREPSPIADERSPL